MKVHIIMENEMGNYSPILVTTSIEKAKAKFAHIMSADNKDTVDLDLVKNIETHTDGFPYGEHITRDYEVILIDGVWYGTEDEMGDKHAMWFEEEVES